MKQTNTSGRSRFVFWHRTRSLRLPGDHPRSGQVLASVFAAVLGVNTMAVQAQDPAALQQCHDIQEAAERLACYDRISDRAAEFQGSPGVNPGSAQTTNGASANGDQPSILEAAWRLNPESERYSISMYNANYILPLRYSNDVNNQPFSPVFDAADIPDQQLDSSEAKFQLSLKARVWSTDDRRWGLWLAYTQQNNWQIYNEAISRPFRETNYMPEVFGSYQTDLRIAGLDLRLINFGYSHQSNGRVEPISRSWDRLFVEFGLDRENLALMLRFWKRIEESEGDDDNADITDYYGHSELNAYYRWGTGDSLALKTRGNLSTGQGAVQLGWFSRPFIGPLRGYVQVFSGYGESMIDYNWNQTTVGIGLALSDGF